MKITIFLVAGLCCALTQSVAGKSVPEDAEPVAAAVNNIINLLPMPLPLFPTYDPNQGPVFRNLNKIAVTTEKVTRRIIQIVRNDVEEISFYMNSNMELFSAEAVSEVYPLFQEIDNKIAANASCGSKFTPRVNKAKISLEKEITDCGLNLTKKREEHLKKLSVHTVKLDARLDEINNLSKKCLQNGKAVESVICQVNGLESANDAIVATQNDADFDNAQIENDIPKIIENMDICSEIVIANLKKELNGILVELEIC